MTEFFEAFNPGARHWREQQELDKVLVVDTERGDDGPRPLDLDSGHVRLVMPRRGGTQRKEPAASNNPDTSTDSTDTGSTDRDAD